MAEAVKKTPFLARLASLILGIPRAPFELRRYRTWVPPGHYYSPVPDLDEVRRNESRIFGVPAALPGIDLNADGQLRLLDELAAFYGDMPFTEDKKPGLRYYFNNDAYCHTDAIVLFSMLRHLRPKKLIEVGSGFSSAVSLDTNDQFLNGSIDFTFIEPYPERLLALLTEKDRAKIALIKKPLQEVELDLFKKLKAGDVLFIDSTHVAKTGSDVNYILFEILPALSPGVWIHFHDIMYPFEYPKEWVYEGRAWNEAYMLRAFLQYNSGYRIRFFNTWMHRFHGDIIGKKMPVCLRNTGGSIWIEKLAAAS
jgi:Methyltransferase domain